MVLYKISCYYRWNFQKGMDEYEDNPNVEYRWTTVENPICENIDKRENDKYDILTYEEDRNQQARENKTYEKGEKSHTMEIKHSMTYKK